MLSRALRHAPRDDAYDVIVVGCGLGGISAAALLAKAGRKVLAVERQDGVGGCGHAFRRGEYLFDPAIHVLEEAKDGASSTSSCAISRCATRSTSSGSRTLPHELPRLLAEGAVRARGDRRRARRGRAGGGRRGQGVLRAAPPLLLRGVAPVDVGLAEDLDRMVEQFPVFFRYRNATVGDVLDEYFVGERAKAICSSIWPYLGLPPVAAGLVHVLAADERADRRRRVLLQGQLPAARRRVRDRARARRRRADPQRRRSAASSSRTGACAASGSRTAPRCAPRS